MAGEDLRLPIERLMLADLAIATWASSASVGMPPSIRWAGAAAWATPAHPFGQA